jgi:transcriptional regulator with XRE-family HTH domain
MKDRFKIVSIKLAATIRRRRKELGYSQETFALQVGVDRTYMSKIERSIGNPSLEKLVLISAALNCTLNELFEEA